MSVNSYIPISNVKQTSSGIPALNISSADKSSSIFSIKKTEGAGDINEINGAQGSQQAQAILDEIQTLALQKQDNLIEIGRLEQQIIDLTRDAEDSIEEAQEAKEKAIADYEEKCRKIAADELQKYEEANKTGKGMTKDELNQNIKNAFDAKPDLSAALTAIAKSKEAAAKIKDAAEGIKDLIAANETIDSQIASLQEQYQQAQQAASSSSGSDGGCDSVGPDNDTDSGSDHDDPIGFEYDGESWDFIKDDGNFDEISDFLGAGGGQFGDMRALDKNGDNKVDIAELKAGNIKLVNGDGTKLLDADETAEKFGSNFYIDTASYDENALYSGNLDTGDADGDGTANQRLIGTFNVNTNKGTIQGYNTLDDKDYLSSKFGISKGGADNPAQNSEAAMPADASDARSAASNAEAEASEIDSKAASLEMETGMDIMNADMKKSQLAFQTVSSAQDYTGEENNNKNAAEKNRPASFFERFAELFKKQNSAA